MVVSLGDESELERALVRSAAFLRFANRFAAETPELPAGWRVDDDLLARFRLFVEGERVAYRTDAERTADALAEDLGEAGYDGAERALAGLRQAIEQEKAPTSSATPPAWAPASNRRSSRATPAKRPRPLPRSPTTPS